MEITNRFKNALAAFKKTENAVSFDANSFLRYGSHNRMPSTWTTPVISDQDFYTGLGFAVINKRANRSVVLGKNFLYTDAKDEIITEANQRGERVIHPYLDLIRSSTDFSERDFWYDISTYLDLEGIYYLMVVRTVTPGRVGNVQKFTLLNPYKVRAVTDSKGNLGGYVEQHNDKQRQIPKEMIIPIKLLNPFDQNQVYSLADAARDSQFTLKQANDFAREAIDGNLNAPGILSSAIELPDDQFDNFVDRVKNHGRGEPLFGNGAGTVTWADMQTDLDKAALDKINTINRDALLAISGLSKTGIGVEESGTGREVSRTQKDDFTESAIMPQIENIIDALNLDYRKYYADSYRRNGYNIALDNPLETDRDAEAKDVEIRDSQFSLLQSLLAQGYPYDIASKYAKGLIDITDLGEAPVKADDETPSGDGQDPNEPNNDPSENDPDTHENGVPFYENSSTEPYEGYPVPVVQYLGDLASQIVPASEEKSVIYAAEKHDMVRIKFVEEFYQSLIGVVDDNTYVLLGEFKNNADRTAIIAKLNKRYKNQAVAVKKKIDHDCSHHVYDVIKNATFDKQAQLQSNTANLQASAISAEQSLYQWYVDEISNGNLNPHPTDLDKFIESLTLPFAVFFTVMFPIYAAYRIEQTAKDLGIRDQLPITAITEEVRERINEFARKEATSHMNTVRTDLENALAKIRANTSDPQEIKSQLEQAFNNIQQRRSVAIASNAAARIFNMSQYEADIQFLTRADLLDKAYKQLYSMTGDPCPICDYLIKSTDDKPIPFMQSFANVGDTIRAGGITMNFNYEDIEAGNVHPNCNCAYRLIIEDDIT